MAILYGEIDKDTKREKIHYNRGDMVASQTINDIQDTAIDAHNMATEALDKADSVFQGNGTVVSVGGREVGTLAFSSDPQQQLDTLNAKITTSSSFNAEIVDQLPTENISSSTFYLVPNSTSANDNTYSEYLYVNGKWELLGNTQVQAYDDSELRELINGLSTTKANKTDLANYYTKDQTYNITEVDAKVINLVSTSYLKSELNPIKTDVNTNKTNIATLQTEIVGKADKTDLDNYTKISDLAKVAISNDYNDLDNTPNTDLMVDIINEHSDSINEINAELAGKANKSEIPSISGLASESYVNTQVNTLQGKIDAKVDKTTTINSKPLSSNITLTAGDVGALPNTTAIPKLYDEMGENVDGAVTQKALYEIIIALGDEFGGAISELNTTKANQSDLDTTNANVSANTTAIGNKLDKVENSTTPQVYGVDALGSQTMYELSNTVRNGGLVSRFGEQILVPTTPTQDQSATSKSYVDKVDGEIYSHINSEIERVEGLIANAGGTVVTIGGTNKPVTTLNFDSNPQTQITNLETSLYNTKVILESNVSTNASDIDKLETKKADRTEIPDISNLATKDEIPTDYVTTNTDQNIGGQKVFDDIHTTNTITFHNNNADYNATYKGFIYQYNDQIDISRNKEADSSDFSGVFSLKLDSKELYIGGTKMATITNVNNTSMKPSNNFQQVSIASYLTANTTVFTATSNGFATIRGNYTGNCSYYLKTSSGKKSFYQRISTSSSPFWAMKNGDSIVLETGNPTISWADLYFVKADTIS